MSKSYIGKGELSKLGKIIEEVGSERIFLVTGKSSYEDSDCRKTVEEILKEKIYTRYSDFAQNPCYEDILEGIKKVREFSPDLIIAIGGGSVLDTAKLLSVLLGEGINVSDIITGNAPVPERKVSLVLIPTTAGSGSECTHFAVVYKDNKKYSVGTKVLLPDYAIVDPELTYDVPPYLTAVTAFDALSQAIESYWSIASTEESREYASLSIKKFMEIFNVLIENPDEHSRDVMMQASHLAGKAINITKTTAAHALSYGFTMRYGIPHGHAVMLTLPSLFIYNAQTEMLNPGISVSQHQERIDALCALLSAKNADEASLVLRNMMSKAGLNLIQEDKGMNIAAEVNIERLKNNPVHITEEGLRNIVNSAFINE